MPPKKTAAPGKKTPATKPPAKPARKPAEPARKHQDGPAYDGSRVVSKREDDVFVPRFQFLSDDRIALAALARRFYPELSADAARVKLHAHLSATANARSFTAEEESKLFALVQDFALHLLQHTQHPLVTGDGRRMDLIWKDGPDGRYVEAVDAPTGLFRVFIPAYEPIPQPKKRPEPFEPERPRRFNIELDDFGR